MQERAWDVSPEYLAWPSFWLWLGLFLPTAAPSNSKPSPGGSVCNLPSVSSFCALRSAQEFLPSWETTQINFSVFLMLAPNLFSAISDSRKSCRGSAFLLRFKFCQPSSSSQRFLLCCITLG